MDVPDRSRTEDLLGEARFVQALARSLLRDADLAHDVAQDALAAALQQQHKPASWRAWLAAVTRRLAHAVRHDQRERSRREGLVARPEGGDDERRTLARLALHRRLCDAVLALPEPYRTAVTLRYLDGLSPRAIAGRLSRDVEVVRQHVHRGLALLRQKLDREFGDRSGWTAAFAACGLGGMSATATLVGTVLMMKKVAVAACALLAVGAWWVWRERDASAPPADATGALPVAAAARGAAANAPPAAAAVSPSTTEAVQRRELLFAVTVVDDERRPLRDVVVRCWREQGEAVVQRTDVDGRAAFAPSDGKGALRVEAAARPPVLLQVERLVGEQQVVLPRGAEVSGQVLVDGAPAPAGLRLGLRMPKQELPLDLPAEAERWLQDQAWRPQCEVRTQAGGGFAFRGLPADWSGILKLPSPYWWLPQAGVELYSIDEHSLTLPAPAAGLALEATQLPTVSGKVVWDDTGEPAERPDITCFAQFAGGDSSPLTSVSAESDGSFAVGFTLGDSTQRERWYDPGKREAMTSVKLWIRAPGSDGQTELELDAEQLRRPLQVRLRRAAATCFLAVDEKGAPIAEACVLASGHGISELTGGDGRGTFTGPRDKGLVGAPGYRVVPLAPRSAAAGTAADPLVFVLTADSELRLRMRDPDGGVPSGCHMQLRSATSLFAGRVFQSELDRRFGSSEAGGSAKVKKLPDGSVTHQDVELRFDANIQGDVVLHSLLPGLPAAVEVRDRAGTMLLRQDITTPASGENKTVDVVVIASPRQLRGRVLGADGLPLAGAGVACEVAGFAVIEGTAADGTFTFDGVYANGALRLLARKNGFAAAAVDGLARDRDGQEIEIRMQPGHPVHVMVRDAAGQIVPVRIDTNIADLLQEQRQELAAGDYQFADLPPGTVTFHCQLGGQRFDLAHDTSNPNAVLRVPTPARAVIVAPVGWPEPEKGFYLVAMATRLDAAGEPFELQLVADDKAPQLLLPGRYRIALVAQRWQDDKPDRRPLGPAAEVELRAGETARVLLH